MNAIGKKKKIGSQDNDWDAPLGRALREYLSKR